MTYNNDVHPRTTDTAVQWHWVPTLEEPTGVWIQPPDYEVGGSRNFSNVDDASYFYGVGFDYVAYEATWPIDTGVQQGNVLLSNDSLWNEYGSVSACCLANAYDGLRRFDLPEITVWDAFQYTSYPCSDGFGEYGNPIIYSSTEGVNAIGAYRMVMGGARITAQWQNYARGGSTEGVWYYKLNPDALTKTGVTWDFTSTQGWPVGGPGWPPPTGGLGMSGGASTEQIAQWASQVGFAGNSLQIAVAVALAESSGVIDATHLNLDGSIDYGLWQINSVHVASGFSPVNAFDPVYNASWAWRISSGGTDWTPWTTYNSGAYLQYFGTAGEVTGNIKGGTIPSGSPQPLAQPVLGRSIEFESAVGRVVGAKLEGYLEITGGQRNFENTTVMSPSVEAVAAQIRAMNPGSHWITHDYGGTSWPYFRYDIGFSWLSRSQMGALPVLLSGTQPADTKGMNVPFGDWYVQNTPNIGTTDPGWTNPVPSIDISQYVNTTDWSIALLVTTQNQIDAEIPTWSPALEDGPFGGPLIMFEQYLVRPRFNVKWIIRPPRHRWLPTVSEANGEPKRVIYEHVKSVPTDYWG